ncbi:MAG: PaaI family thioesterase [Bacteriovoracaceae bacterium]|nr:PaaI family thioesterase [Bacteriovoracaceae bacterium]
MTPEELLSLYKKISNFDRHMGMHLTCVKQKDGGHELIYKMVIKKEHLSSPDSCHGGVLSAFMDAVLGVPVLTYAVGRDMLCSTVEFKMNFLGPAKLGDVIVGKNIIDFKGKSLVVSSATLVNEVTGAQIAKGMGTFNLYPTKKRDFFNLNPKIKML